MDEIQEWKADPVMLEVVEDRLEFAVHVNRVLGYVCVDTGIFLGVRPLCCADHAVAGEASVHPASDMHRVGIEVRLECSSCGSTSSALRWVSRELLREDDVRM